MTLWTALLIAGLVSLATKLAGFLAPQRLLQGARTSRIMALLPVAMLAALVAVQSFAGAANDAGGQALTLDARAVALACAFAALLARVPFLAVIVLAAAVAAVLRALGWAG